MANDDDEKKKKSSKVKDGKKKTTTALEKASVTANDDDENMTSSSPASTKKGTNATAVVPTYEERCLAVNSICYPLANKKSTKKCHKLVRKVAGSKTTKHQIRRGVKEVIKGIRKGETGLVILAGDIYPIDVISHLPILLEEKNIPYLFVPSKFDLGAAASTKRPTSCVLIKDPTTSTNTKVKSAAAAAAASNNKGAAFPEDVQELYDALVKEGKDYDPTTSIITTFHHNSH